MISEILKGIKKAADDGRVTFQEYPTQTKNYNLPYCIQVTIQHQGRKLSTWGAGHNKDEAALKAIMEMVERLTFLDSWSVSFRSLSWFSKYESYHSIQKRYIGSLNWLFSTTSGLAVHTSKRNAIKNAVNELIERHVILKSLAHKISPAKIDMNALELPFSFPQSLDVDAFHWKGPLGRHVVMIRMQLATGALYGFGCELNRDLALNKAIFESSGMMVAASLGIKKDSKTLSQHLVDQETIRQFHLQNNETTMSRLLTDHAPTPPEVDTHITKRDVFFSERNLPAFFDSSLNLKIVRAVSPLTQPLFFDHWRPQVINPVAMGEDTSLPEDLHVVV